MALRKRKLVAAQSAYLDPLHCDSQIAYKVVEGARGIWGSVQLSDCQHKLEWYFNTTAASDKTKIDKAIDMLTEFRTLLQSARTEQKATKRKVRARKATVAA